MSIEKRPRAIWFLLAFQSVAACNTVLGIEPAELNDSSGEALTCTPWPRAEPKSDCAGSCDEACSANCDVGGCLADKACRVSLLSYRKCVGNACIAGQGECAGCASESPKATELFKCLGKCDCSPAGAATLCESYCACMETRCDQNEPGGPGGCMKACQNGAAGYHFPTLNDPSADALWNSKPPDWQVYCLWKHCEKATKPNDGSHCDHAVGHGRLCNDEPSDNPSGPLCAYPKGYGNAPCNTDNDCCGTCTGAGVCTSP